MNFKFRSSYRCTHLTDATLRQDYMVTAPVSYTHLGYAVKCRAALLVDRGEHYQWVEAFQHYFRTAVCQAVHGGKYHAKAVEQWYADAELVIGGKLHVLTGKETVVGNVVVGKHDAFRESRSAGGVLHVHYIVASDLTFELIQATDVYKRQVD